MARPAAPIGTTSITTRGYRRVKVGDHPVAGNDGWALEHRLVLFDAIGPGVHPCHHCSRMVEWGSTLAVDHRDHDRLHNVAENLVPACSRCNSMRWEMDPASGMGGRGQERIGGSGQ